MKFQNYSFNEPHEGQRHHKLMPKELRDKIPKLYAQDGVKDKTIYAKFFSPYSGYTLWIAEFDGQDTIYGYVTGMDYNEWGYASLSELSNSNRNGLPLIERDKSFRPKKFKSIKFGRD